MTRISGADNFRNMRAAVDAIAERQPGLTKPTLKRYTWSRLHSDLLDDNRWSLVAKRAHAPLPVVEAMVIRLETHANNSEPRGDVCEFSAEAMAARWNVEAELILRIYAELERPDIGWISQDQIVSFWRRNPDKVDETAAERQQRARDRKKGMKQLAAMARQGVITEAQRAEREVALRTSKEPVAVIAAWAGASRRDGVTVTRDSVTVTPRAEQIIKQEAAENAETVTALGGSEALPKPAQFADKASALQWLRGEGEVIVTTRCSVMKSRATQLIRGWSVTLGHDVTALAGIVLATSATNAQGAAFEKLIVNQVARQATEMLKGAPLPLMPPRPGQRRS